MKKFFTLIFFAVSLAVQLEGQTIFGKFEISVSDLPGGATNRAVVKARAINNIIPNVSSCDANDVFFTDIFAGFKFAVKYPTSSLVTNVNVGINNAAGACPDPSDNGGTLGHFNITRANSTPFIENGFRVTIFQQGADPIPCPIDWVLNNWITICTLNISQVAPGCTTCEDLDIADPSEFPTLSQSQDLDHTLAFQDVVPPALEYNMAPNNGPLPLNLLSFTAEKAGTNDALLSWTTANEVNTSHFQIQRSYDKVTWLNVGKVDAAGFSIEIRNYTFTDYQVYNGRDARLKVYYRLNMVDIDTHARLSPIQSVLFGNGLSTGKEFVVYPNPASDGVHVEWDANLVDQPTSLEFYDIAGKFVHSVVVPNQTNQQYVDFSHTNIQAGLYLMRVMNGDQAIEHKQIVVGKDH